MFEKMPNRIYIRSEDNGTTGFKTWFYIHEGILDFPSLNHFGLA